MAIKTKFTEAVYPAVVERRLPPLLVAMVWNCCRCVRMLASEMSGAARASCVTTGADGAAALAVAVTVTAAPARASVTSVRMIGSGLNAVLLRSG